MADSMLVQPCELPQLDTDIEVTGKAGMADETTLANYTVRATSTDISNSKNFKLVH
jgi:hypothetical protein